MSNAKKIIYRLNNKISQSSMSQIFIKEIKNQNQLNHNEKSFSTYKGQYFLKKLAM